jgi:hypothetical protein
MKRGPTGPSWTKRPGDLGRFGENKKNEVGCFKDLGRNDKQAVEK